MRRWETLIALLAVVLASLSAVNMGGRPHPALAFAAIAVLVALLYARLRASVRTEHRKRSFDAYERALRIQERREGKYRR